MPIFDYKARTKEGEERKGSIDVSSQEAAVELLQQNNLVVFFIGERKKPFYSGFSFSFRSGAKSKDIVLFSRQLATLFEAHIPAVPALKTLAGETQKEGLRQAIAEILDDVSGGLALSQAMAKQSHIFSSFYIHMVRSGEESGKLQEVFTYLADYLERSYYLATKAKNAMIYPAFVMAAFVGVMTVMLVVVIPRLTSIFTESGQSVPFYTQIIIGTSSFLQHWGLLLLMLLVAGAIVAWRWGMTPLGKEYFHRLQLHVPITGELYKKLYMTRLTDNLRTLITGGIPLMRALAITGDVVGNVIYQKAVEDAIESVKGGSTISAAFERNPEIPVLVTQMIRVGESSGRLDFILGSIARFYQKEVDSLVENLVSLIEPVLIVVLGIGVALLMVAVLVPLYNLVGNI